MDRLKKHILWLLVLVIVLTCNYISVVSAQSDEPYTVTIGNNAVFKISNSHMVGGVVGENSRAKSEFQEAETYVHSILTGDLDYERDKAYARNGVIFTVYDDGTKSSANATVSIKVKYYYLFIRRAGDSNVWAMASARFWAYLVNKSDDDRYIYIKKL